jgi:hypothetical protein
MGKWRRLHKEEIHNLYLSPNIIRHIKSRRMRWVQQVSFMAAEVRVYKVLVGKPKGKRPLRRLTCRYKLGTASNGINLIPNIKRIWSAVLELHMTTYR